MTISKMIGVVIGISSSAAIYPFYRFQAKELIDCHDCHMKRLPKAKELSLYERDDDLTVEYDERTKLPLLSEISMVRQQVFGLASYFNVFKDEIVHIYETGTAHTQSSYDYIISEENRIPRILAIISGGFVGYLFARKRGVFKKILFFSTGTGVVFSAFYPALTKEYALTGWEHTKYYTSNVLEKYGGYDTQKLAEETNEKMEHIKSFLKLEGVTNQFKVWFDKNKEKVTKTLNITTDPKDTKEVQEKSSKSAEST